MDDPEVQETVEAILGKGVQVVDCEKKSSVKEEEVLYINNIPVTLEGRDGMAIKEALITGQIPPSDLLNKLLINSGILKAPVKLDTSLSVKSTTVIKEEVTVSRDGKIIDERSRETKDRSYYTSAMTEIFEPIKIIPTAELLNGRYNGSSSSNNTFSNHHHHNVADDSNHSKWSKYGGSTSSTSSYESEEAATTTTIHSNSNGKPKHCLSKDSGHISGTVTDNKINNDTMTQNSVDSLSSYDETDFVCEQLNKCASFTNGGDNGGYVNGYLPKILGPVACPERTKPRSSSCSNRGSPQASTIKKFSTNFARDASQGSSGDSSLHNRQDKALVYRDGTLYSGSLESLILHMVPTETYYPDRPYLFAFLLSSRLFIRPYDLLARIRAIGDQQQGLIGIHQYHQQIDEAQMPTPYQKRYAEKMVQLLTEWTEIFPYDFRDWRMMDHARRITSQCCLINPSLRPNVSMLLHNLHPRLSALEEYEKLMESHANSASSEELCGLDISELCPNPEKLAQQLTHVELEKLSFIGPEEFVQECAKEYPALESSFKDMKKTKNLELYVQWFNRLSYFVATQVCKYHKKKQRVKMMEYWIETGRECFNIGNFNSLMAIISGLNMSPISRLKKTWSKIQSGKFSILEHQMDPSSNFSSYRSTLKAAMWRSAGATDQRQRIVIPFFSLLVKDLYFLNQGCSNKLANGHINFEKFWQLGKQVREFMSWKQVTCPFEKDHRVQYVLQHGLVLNENALALASFECEPPDSNQEKERCKTLKAESGGGGSSSNN